MFLLVLCIGTLRSFIGKIKEMLWVLSFNYSNFFFEVITFWFAKSLFELNLSQTVGTMNLLAR